MISRKLTGNNGNNQPTGRRQLNRHLRRMGKAPNRKAPAAPTAPMDAKGVSKATKEAKANHMRIANACLEWLPDDDLKMRAGADWAKIPLAVIADRFIWRYLGTFLSEVYEIDSSKKNPGGHMKNIEQLWSNLFHEASLRLAVAADAEAKARAPPPPACTLAQHLIPPPAQSDPPPPLLI